MLEDNWTVRYKDSFGVIKSLLLTSTERPCDEQIAKEIVLKYQQEKEPGGYEMLDALHNDSARYQKAMKHYGFEISEIKQTK